MHSGAGDPPNSPQRVSPPGALARAIVRACPLDAVAVIGVVCTAFLTDTGARPTDAVEGIGAVLDAPALGAGGKPVLGSRSRAVACRDAFRADAVIADTLPTLRPLAELAVGLRLWVAGGSAAAPGLAWPRIRAVVVIDTPDTLALLVTCLRWSQNTRADTLLRRRRVRIACSCSSVCSSMIRRTAPPDRPSLTTLGPVLLQRMDALAVAVTDISRAGVAIVGAAAALSLFLITQRFR